MTLQRGWIGLVIVGLVGCGGPSGEPRIDGSTPDGGPAPGVCGDGTLDLAAGEQCDDGNTAAGDGCASNCQIEAPASCGDGNLDLANGERCDDGNTSAGDGCGPACQIEAPTDCGDGTLNLAAGEQCDDGNTSAGDGCGPNCQYEPVGALCGDGVVDPGEACDDGNTTNGDGCNATCNFTGTTTAFVGQAGSAGSVDGIGAAARVEGWGGIVADTDSIWFAEGGTTNVLRRIDIATADITTVATIMGVEGITTNGVDTVWVAGGNGTTLVVQAIDTTTFAVTDLISSAPCASAACYQDGAPGTATFGGIRGLTWLNGYLWIVDPPAATIRRLDPSTGDVVTIAGSPFNSGYVDGVGSAALFTSPRYIVSDNSGVLYISDTNGAAIRALNVTTTEVTTFAGNGTQAYLDGTGTAARVHRPRGITTDGTSVYWTEFNAHTIRQGIKSTQEVSTLIGVPMSAGYAEGTGSSALLDGPFSVTFHFPSKSLFFLDGNNNVIRRIQ